ncbi:related to pisatin demethylase cytochrome P450 [Phialocephala subalpina]|uniref:Related to pisatin demethylase cytochrome P450 n=1 Tax=Phialocephala subalpina TaxID=576137 RepID=A0A1L7XJK8_9HELO|nr:related to pisatin demethylase cytochrome P450 [Phialocephala subalpina]
MDAAILTAGAVAIAAQVYLSPIPEVSSVKVLVTLTLIRRALFSPLSSFPGPRLYGLSTLFKINLYRSGEGGYALLDLHNKYNSDIIRIAPNELSVRDVEAIERLYKGKYPRGTPYDVAKVEGSESLNTARDYRIHTPWRRVWERAFTNSQLKEYTPRVEHHVSKLVDVIRKGEGQEVNVLKIMENFVFDIMADLSFAQDSGMQDGTRVNDYMEFLHKYMAAIVILGNLRPLLALMPYLPVSADVKAHRRRCQDMLAERVKLGKTRKDIFTHLLDPEIDPPAGKSTMFTPGELDSNANLMVIAGADTTSSTMTQLFRELALNPKILKKLQQEVDEHCASGGEISVEGTKSLAYSNAVINEALRLLNPLPSGIYAATPPAGLTFPVFGDREKETFIPGNVQVMIPHLAIMTDERYFPKGDEFIPERWSGKWDEGVLDRRAFIPFGYGAHSCVGKQLALNEMRMALASILKEWSIELGEKYDEKQWKDGFKDYHVVKIGDLWVKFAPRT